VLLDAAFAAQAVFDFEVPAVRAISIAAKRDRSPSALSPWRED
jgi:hypothetical protein